MGLRIQGLENLCRAAINIQTPAHFRDPLQAHTAALMAAKKWKCRFLGSRELQPPENAPPGYNPAHDCHEAVAVIHHRAKDAAKKKPAVAVRIADGHLIGESSEPDFQPRQALASISECFTIGKVCLFVLRNVVWIPAPAPRPPPCSPSPSSRPRPQCVLPRPAPPLVTQCRRHTRW